jgi:hypothetical protein
MAAITLADLQPLLDQATGPGTILSCYAALGGTDGFLPLWEVPFRNKEDALKTAAIGDEEARAELDKNLAAIRQGLEALRSTGARWAVAFSSIRRGFFRAFALDVPVEPELVLDRSAYLVPALAAMQRRREYLAVQTDTHRGRIYSATPAGAQILAEFDENVPKHQHSTGERFGYGQATIVRHREDRIAHYRKDLVTALERAWDTNHPAGVILLGEHEVLEHLRTALPARLANRIVREASEPGFEEVPRAEEAICTLTAEALAESEAEVAPGFWELLQQNAVITGAPAVLEAIQNGRIEAAGHGYLVFGPDPRETVARCLVCNALDVSVSDRCPRCQFACVVGNLWEELLLLAARHGIMARFVADPMKLKKYGGIVAVPAKNKA